MAGTSASLDIFDLRDEPTDDLVWKYAERWFGTTEVGDDSRDESAVEILEELEKVGELSESSYDFVDEADDNGEFSWRSGAS